MTEYYRKVVLLDDGREAYVLGGCCRFGEAGVLDLMFADGSRLHDIEPERVKKALRKLPDQMGSRKVAWPEPWETAHETILQDVQANRKRDATPLPKPSKKTAAAIKARLAEEERIRVWRQEQEDRAWRCDQDADEILAEAQEKASYFDRWLWLKKGATDRLVLYWLGLEVYTYHSDALAVSKVKPLPPTRPYWMGREMNEGPVVLIFSEFHTWLEELLVALVAVGVKVAMVHAGWWANEVTSRLYLFDDGEDVQRYFDVERDRNRERVVAERGSLQVQLPGFA